MRKRSRAFASGVGLVAVASVIAACSSSSSSGSGTTSGSTSLSSGTQGINPGSGTPTSGGTLNMLGTGDVDYMDPDISYYSIGYLGQRPWIRGLYAYPAIPGKTTTPAPDLATADCRVVSSGGTTYSMTIRTGADVEHVAGPPGHRAPTRCSAWKRSCNPVPASFGGLPDFENADRRATATFCARLRQGGSDTACRRSRPTSSTNQHLRRQGLAARHGHLQR